MRRIFGDAAYWIALINPRDDLHTSALHAVQRVGQAQIVTTEMVLVEVLNHFSESNSRIRLAASNYALRLRYDSSVEVVPQSPEQFRMALDLYRRRLDKGWSLTDCASMLLMQEREIRQVLTADHHFEQAGFVILLRARS